MAEENTKVLETEETEETKKATKKATKKEEPERVEVFIPRGTNANDDPNMFVSVNGVNYLLPRGKKSTVPIEVAAEIERAAKAQSILDEHIDEMRGASK